MKTDLLIKEFNKVKHNVYAVPYDNDTRLIPKGIKKDHSFGLGEVHNVIVLEQFRHNNGRKITFDDIVALPDELGTKYPLK